MPTSATDDVYPTERNEALLRRQVGTRTTRDVGKRTVVGFDGKTVRVTAHRSVHKGSDGGHPVQMVASGFLEFGYGCEPVVLTSEQERSSAELQDMSCAKLSSMTISIHAPAGDSEGQWGRSNRQRNGLSSRFGS